MPKDFTIVDAQRLYPDLSLKGLHPDDWEYQSRLEELHWIVKQTNEGQNF